MADRTINSRAFRTEFIRLTEPTAVTALGRVIGVWHPVSVAIDSRALDAIRPGEPLEAGYWGLTSDVTDRPALKAAIQALIPTPRSSPETPAAGRAPIEESKVAGEVRTQETTGAPDTGSPVTAVEADGGGRHATGGHLDPAPQRRQSQAARDKILKAVNRGGMP